MKTNTMGTKLLMLAITLLVLAYFGLQGLRYLTDPLTTTLTYAYEVEEGSDLTGYVVRNEQVLSANNTGGLLRILRREGERVSAGGAVAAVYADQASVDRQETIRRLDDRINQLEYAEESMLGVEASVRLDREIVRSIVNYRAALAASRLDAAEDCAGELRSLVLKRDFTYSGTEDLSAELASLQAERKTLAAQAAGSVRSITAPVSGLFSAVVDGYESTLTPTTLTALTPGQLSRLQPDAAPENAVGKLVLGDDWYYVALVTAAEAAAVKKHAESGTGLTLHFSRNVQQSLAVTLEDVGPEENGRCVLTLRGSTYLPELTLLRNQSCTLTWNTRNGLRVPTEALRVLKQTVTAEDGVVRASNVTGVYCVLGAKAAFKPVDVLYSGDGFALVRGTGSTEKTMLRVGDEVIVTARGLYDGKVVG